MGKAEVKTFKNYVEAQEDVQDCIRTKTDDENLTKVMRILDIIREGGNVSFRKALDILDDAKVVLMETQRVS